ncbi:pentatricopeptide repeat-containing protein At2g38420, mitochondrial-like isoform X2 [Prosopis cineraria]|nr:pentatricopeptide repeat-containing protein At2g38420, mitochondrial-like isoform X2 [Prosopis cineraria]XP_054794819.1 pentatricopeptide repeat-containing protein At2g38420, mitochondrial-like isoform X2 [Prosopis cineraria]
MVRNPLSDSSNKYLRKFRKWPHSPYKTFWHHNFGQHQAMQILVQAATATSPLPSSNDNLNMPSLLSTLIHSFKTYNCDPTPNAYYFLIKTLSRTSRLHEIPLVLDQLERVEKFETPEFMFGYLIRDYGRAGKFQEAIDLFYRIPKFRCVPTICSLNLLLSVLCRNRECLKLVPLILLKSRGMNIRIEESTFGVLIKGLCRYNRVGYAIEMLYCMIEDGYHLDDKICSLIVSSFCDQNDLTFKEALGVWGDMKKFGFCPRMMDYSNLIRFLGKKEKGRDAMGILNQMKEDGIKPDIVCYTMVLSAVVAEGNYVKAHELFDELLVLGLVPDIYTYNVYINCLCKEDNVEEALKMVSSMEDLGCNSNVVTYNTLLASLCEAGELSRARGLLKEMKMKRIELNLHTYRIMLDGLVCKAEITEACSLLDEMLEKCLYPRSSTIYNIIYEMCQKGLVTEALELMEKFSAKSFPPGARAWEALLLNSGAKLSYSEAILADLVKAN